MFLDALGIVFVFGVSTVPISFFVSLFDRSSFQRIRFTHRTGWSALTTLIAGHAIQLIPLGTLHGYDYGALFAAHVSGYFIADYRLHWNEPESRGSMFDWPFRFWFPLLLLLFPGAYCTWFGLEWMRD